MWRGDSTRIPQCLRSDPVLTISAMEVTPEHAETHRKRAGQRVEERFFLYRIELQRTDIAVRHKQLSAAIETDAADAVQAVENYASVPAGETAQPAVLQLFV